MEARVSEILENILGLLSLEGSFEVVEGPEEISVSIEANDPGRLIGFKGETLDALQLIINQILGRQITNEHKEGEEEVKFKRVVIDVAGWRKQKEGDLERRARVWAEEVLEKKQPVELDPMPSWQRRIIHMVIADVPGVESESIGEGKERHLVIKLTSSEKTSPAEGSVLEKAPAKKKSTAKKKSPAPKKD